MDSEFVTAEERGKLLEKLVETTPPQTEPIPAKSETIDPKSETTVLKVETPAAVVEPPGESRQAAEERHQRELGHVSDRVKQLEIDRDFHKRMHGRANTEASEAKGKLDQYERALRQAAAEFNVAGVRTTVDYLTKNAPELPALVRRLARTVREIGPDRDALRLEVRRLNGEILDHPKQLQVKDVEISDLNKQIVQGKEREKALERTTETMQVQRDQAQRQLKDQQAFGLDAARANDELRAKVEDLEDRIKELTAPKDPKKLQAPAAPAGAKTS